LSWSAILILAICALAGAFVADAYAHWRAGVRPWDSVHGALVSLNLFLQLQLLAVLLVMTGFTVARRLAGQLNATRRVVFDNLALLWYYTLAQSLFGLLLIHGFPRAL
jgi:cytochrome c oxidase subunit I+III